MMTIEVFSWIVVGLVAGSLARIAMPGPAAGGIRVALFVGLFGAFVAGFAAKALWVAASDSFWLPFGAATNGALCSLFVYRCFAMRVRDPFMANGTNTLNNVESVPNYGASVDFGRLPEPAPKLALNR